MTGKYENHVDRRVKEIRERMLQYRMKKKQIK